MACLLPLAERIFDRLSTAAAGAVDTDPAVADSWRLAEHAQQLLQKAWCHQGNEEKKLAEQQLEDARRQAEAAGPAAAAAAAEARKPPLQLDSSDTLEGCAGILGLRPDALTARGFSLVNAPLATVFDPELVSLLFFAAEVLKQLGQWGRRPMFAFYPGCKAFEDAVFGPFFKRAFYAACMLLWVPLGGERPPSMVEFFINLLHHAEQEFHHDTHTGRRVVEALQALFSQPGAARGLALRLEGSEGSATVAAQLETGSQGKAVVGDTPGLSTGANVDGRQLKHAAGSGRRMVRWVVRLGMHRLLGLCASADRQRGWDANCCPKAGMWRVAKTALSSSKPTHLAVRALTVLPLPHQVHTSQPSGLGTGAPYSPTHCSCSPWSAVWWPTWRTIRLAALAAACTALRSRWPSCAASLRSLLHLSGIGFCRACLVRSMGSSWMHRGAPTPSGISAWCLQRMANRAAVLHRQPKQGQLRQPAWMHCRCQAGWPHHRRVAASR